MTLLPMSPVSELWLGKNNIISMGLSMSNLSNKILKATLSREKKKKSVFKQDISLPFNAQFHCIAV
jgi:hypothetical protein